MNNKLNANPQQRPGGVRILLLWPGESTLFSYMKEFHLQPTLHPNMWLNILFLSVVKWRSRREREPTCCAQNQDQDQNQHQQSLWTVALRSGQQLFKTAVLTLHTAQRNYPCTPSCSTHTRTQKIQCSPSLDKSGKGRHRAADQSKWRNRWRVFLCLKACWFFFGVFFFFRIPLNVYYLAELS